MNSQKENLLNRQWSFSCFVILFFAISSLTQATDNHSVRCFDRLSDVNLQIEICSEELLQYSEQPEVTSEIRLKLMDLHSRLGNFSAAKKFQNEIEMTHRFELSPQQQLKFLRRKGILLYRQGQLPESLLLFKQAVDLAKQTADKLPLAKALSDLGTAHLAMTQYSLALQLFSQSLAIKEKHASTKSIAITLNNIGSVYRKMTDWEQAKTYYDRAITLYSTIDDEASIAHTNENLGLIFLKGNQYLKAKEKYLKSLTYFRQVKNQHAILRLLILLGNVELLLHKLVESQVYLREAENIELTLGTSNQSTLLKLNLGKLLSRQGHYQQSEAMLLAGLTFTKKQHDRENETLLWQALVNNSHDFNQWEKAFEYQKQLANAELSTFKISFDQTLAKIRGDFEYTQQQKEITLLNKNNQIQQLELSNQRGKMTILSLSLIVLSILTGYFIYWQRLKRKQLKDSLEQKINWHRQQVIQLGISYDSLEAVFGQLDQALLVLNNKQKVLFANNTVTKLLGVTTQYLKGLALIQLVDQTNTDFWLQMNNDVQLTHKIFNNVTFLVGENHFKFQVSVTNMDREEPIIIIAISKPGEKNNLLSIHSLLPTASFHQQLVDLMLSSIEYWEISTQSTRLELAEKSGIWRVSIDDGRLRTRSLDRYLSIKLLPKKPRWREVLRTAHFVLAECKLDESQKQSLSDKLALVTQHIRTEALI